MRAIRKPRNEILEEGQEVVLYHDTTWVGDIRCAGVLVSKISEGDYDEEWEVIPDDDCSDTWWFGSILPIQKDNDASTEK